MRDSTQYVPHLRLGPKGNAPVPKTLLQQVLVLQSGRLANLVVVGDHGHSTPVVAFHLHIALTTKGVR